MQGRETTKRLVSLDLGTPRILAADSLKSAVLQQSPEVLERARTSALISRPKTLMNVVSTMVALKRRATTGELAKTQGANRPRSPPKSPAEIIDSNIKVARKLLQVENKDDLKLLMTRPQSTGLQNHVDRVKKNRAKIEVKENKKSHTLKEINKTKGMIQ